MFARNKKLFIILGSVAGLLVIVLLAQLIIGSISNKCLTNDDLADIAPNATLVSDPKDNFYSYVIEYNESETSNPKAQSTANAIAEFYKSHPRKSIYINITSANQNTTITDTAKSRINTLADSLEKGGVSDSVIQKFEPEFSEMDSNYDGTITATIVSDQECKK